MTPMKQLLGLVLIGFLGGFAFCMAIFGAKAASELGQDLAVGVWIVGLLMAIWLLFDDSVRDRAR